MKPPHTNIAHDSALQRALETPAPSASLVLGDLLTHIANLRTRGAGERGVAVALHVDQHGDVVIQRYALFAHCGLIGLTVTWKFNMIV